MEKIEFKIIIGKEILYPKGFYYQGNNIIIVGCNIKNHTIRRKEKISDVIIEILNNKNE